MQLAGNRSLGDRLPQFRVPQVDRPGCPATKPAHLLRFAPTPRPQPGFRKNRRPSTCGFIFANNLVVGGCRPNVVDGRVSWRTVCGGGRKGPRKGRRRSCGRSRGCQMTPTRRAAALPPPVGRAPRAFSALRARLAAQAQRRRKIFQNCPCIAVRVPV